MSSAAKSILVFGVYLVALGAALIAVPNVVLGVFSYPPTTEVWLRVAGVVVLLLGVYYIAAARSDLVPFFRATVYARPTVICFFGAFVLLGFARPILLLFGAVDLLGAIWTGLALRAAPARDRSSR